VGMLLAIGAGALSFLSPCVLPIFPAYMSYITGVSVKELQGEQNAKIRRTLLSHSLIFLLGVSLVFIVLGAGASFLCGFIIDFSFRCFSLIYRTRCSCILFRLIYK